MMPNTPVWLLLFILLLVVASLRTRTRVGLAAGLALIAVGGVIALSGVPHLRDPLILMCIEFLVGALLLLAASRIAAHRLPAVPPPPS